MTITQRLKEVDGIFEIHNEGEWSNTSSVYSAFNDAGIECETGEFLYSLVRFLKPDFVLETGTHWGVGASYMGLGLKDNGSGQLDTIEFLSEIYRVADERIKRLGLEFFVNRYLMDVADFKPMKHYKLMLLDTEPQTRFSELVKFYPYLEEGGFVFIHDLHRHMHQIPNADHGFAWPYGAIPQEMTDLVTSGKLRPMHFTTPRGFTGFYKTHKDDYKWS